MPRARGKPALQASRPQTPAKVGPMESARARQVRARYTDRTGRKTETGGRG